ncbi:hypothetical protein [Mycoplasmopsis glycophila]|nr:hypothetical protein [Mycoplasmopsis glycophila]
MYISNKVKGIKKSFQLGNSGNSNIESVYQEYVNSFSEELEKQNIKY